jgi:RND superfamily putative drug exporter
MATAGRAIVFSGCTVAIGLLGLTFYHFGAIGSIGVAGTFAVALAVAFTLTFLASLLAILGPRVNKVRMPFVHPDRQTTGSGFWHGLSRKVMARPWQVLIPTVAVLLLFAIPVTHIRLGWSDYTTMPKSSPSRQAQEVLVKQFPGGQTNENMVVVNFGNGSPLSPSHVAQTRTLGRWLATLPNVTHVESAFTAAPGLSDADYERVFSVPRSQVNVRLQASLKQYVGKHIAVLNVYTPYRASSDQARNIVKEIRNDHPAVGGQVLVTGATAFDVDGIKEMIDDSPMAIGFVMLATYLVLFLLLGSVLLPLKAILMNLLSVTAAFGVLVFGFQDGHFAGLLGFTPNPIDISLPIVMFCILFGLSMDYEVILLSRFKEIYDRTGDNAEAVALGLERTGRLVTGAALIMAAVFYSYGVADDEYIKAFGIGLGTAVVVDAAIIRTLLVPAAMRLMGRWNWWAPAPLARLHSRLGLGEQSVEPQEIVATAPANAAQ